MEDITVLGCCAIVWKPPADMGGERPGYIVRFYDGETFQSSSIKEKVSFADDPEMNFAEYSGNCPTNGPFYADVCETCTLAL